MGSAGSQKRPLGGALGTFGWDGNVIILSLTTASIKPFLVPSGLFH